MNDWENENDYLNEDCRSAKVWNGFDHSEFVETPCSEVVENYAECPAGMGTPCSADGQKTIVANGEKMVVACDSRKRPVDIKHKLIFIYSSSIWTFHTLFSIM